MTTPTKREPDTTAPTDDGHFTFTAGGVDYRMPVKTLDVITVGFVRKNRRRDETDYTFTCLEALAGSDDQGTKILDAIDNLTRDEFKTLNGQFNDHLGATLGQAVGR